MTMAGKYVDGFVVPVPKKNIDAYKAFSEKAGQVWKDHGALEYVECIADDVKPGKVTSFPQAVKLEDDEVGGSVGFEVVTVDPLPPSIRRKRVQSGAIYCRSRP